MGMRRNGRYVTRVEGSHKLRGGKVSKAIRSLVSTSVSRMCY